MRRVLSKVFSSEPDIEVTGSAPNGKVALAQLASAKPDVVTLDVEMPEMDGFQTLRELRSIDPKLPVIMFSAATKRGAVATIDALTLGASDYVTKPVDTAGPDESLNAIRAQLVPKVRALGRRETHVDAAPSTKCSRRSSRSVRLFRPPAVPKTPTPAAPTTKEAGPALHRPVFRDTSAIRIVAIGVSTGGPEALARLLPSLPKHFPAPIVVVQHMPPTFTPVLAERLAERCALDVHHGVDGALLTPGSIWIAPGDYHVTVHSTMEGLRLGTNQDPPENSSRPSVDVLFRSVANACGANALAIIMTGMGRDGTRGAETLRAVGAQVIAQDQGSSVVWGMPGSVVAAGLADIVLPLAGLATEIDRRVRSLPRRPTAEAGMP